MYYMFLLLHRLFQQYIISHRQQTSDADKMEKNIAKDIRPNTKAIKGDTFLVQFFNAI